MDSNKNLPESLNNGKSKNSEKGSFVLNRKICKKGKYPKLWKRYLELKSVLCLQQFAPKEESVYNLRYLFETPSQISEYASGSSHQSLRIKVNDTPIFKQLDKNNKIEKAQLSNIKLQIVNDNIPLTTEQLSHCLNEAEHALSTNKATSISGSNLPSYGQMSSSAGPSNQNVKIEIHNSPKTQKVRDTNLLKRKAPNIVVIQGSDVFEISDDDEYENVSQSCDKSTSQSYLSDSLNNPSKKQNLCETSKSLTGLTDQSNLSKKFSEESSNHSCNIKVYQLPHENKNYPKNKAKRRSENSSTSESYLPKMDYSIKNIGYPSINLKIYNTSAPRIDKSAEDLKMQIKNASHILENVKSGMENIVKKTETVVNKNDRKELFTKDFTQNIFEIGKDMMQSIQGAIFKTCSSNSSSQNNLCEAQKTDNNDKQNNRVSTKVNNETQQSASASQLTDGAEPYGFDAPNNDALLLENLKINDAEKRKLLNSNKFANLQNLNESIQTNSEESKTLLTSSSASKRSPQFLSLRQRQMELHHLKVRVEKKRLEMLDLKLAREWEEMEREKIIFERYFCPTQMQLNMTDDLVEI